MSATDPTSAAPEQPGPERSEQPEDLPRLSPSGLYNLLRPSRCDLREWLRSHGYEEEPPSPYREVLFEMGHEHERRHLERFPDAVDIAELPRERQTKYTAEELRAGDRAVYQGVLRAPVTLAGVEAEIIGHPDFMLHARSG
jgi:hypothetical protein